MAKWLLASQGKVTMIPISIPGFADPFSSWTHLLAAGAALVGVGFLYHRGRGNLARLISLMVFSFALMFLFSMSGVFHLLNRGGEARSVLQRLDHAGIWTLIAGTFTPIHTILFRGPHRWGILITVWTIAITALVLEVVFFTSFPESLILCMFLGLGWVGAFTMSIFKKTFRDPSGRLLIAGGVFYSIGAVIDFIRWPVLIPDIIGPHEIFHVFVILGALSHWLFIYHWAGHPVMNEITFHVRVFPSNLHIAKAVGENIHVEASSLDEIKVQIRKHVEMKFHSTIRPSIKLRYFQEEHL